MIECNRRTFNEKEYQKAKRFQYRHKGTFKTTQAIDENGLVKLVYIVEYTRKTDIYKLASAINDFYDDFLPWDYVNAYESKEEGLKAFLDVLTNKPEFVYNELMDIYNEYQETKALNLAFEMVQRGILQ